MIPVLYELRLKSIDFLTRTYNQFVSIEPWFTIYKYDCGMYIVSFEFVENKLP